MRPVHEIAQDVHACATAHEPGVRLLGNVLAAEVAHLAEYATAASLEPRKATPMPCAAPSPDGGYRCTLIADHDGGHAWTTPNLPCDRCGARNTTLKNEQTFLFCRDRVGCDERKAARHAKRTCAKCGASDDKDGWLHHVEGCQTSVARVPAGHSSGSAPVVALERVAAAARRFVDAWNYDAAELHTELIVALHLALDALPKEAAPKEEKP